MEIILTLAFGKSYNSECISKLELRFPIFDYIYRRKIMEESTSVVREEQELEEECMRKIDDATKEWDEVQEIVPSFARDIINDGFQGHHSSRNVKAVSYTHLTLPTKA